MENYGLWLFLYSCFPLYPFGLLAAISTICVSLVDGHYSKFFSKFVVAFQLLANMSLVLHEFGISCFYTIG